MSDQPKIMTDADGREVSVNSYEDALRVMASFHEVAARLAPILYGNLESARKYMLVALQLRKRFHENLEIYQHFAAYAEIRSTAAELTDIANQTRALVDSLASAECIDR